MSIRKLSFFDSIIQQADKSLKAITGTLNASFRESPSTTETPFSLTKLEKKHSSGLMRVNHTGEVCAQALYLGQACVAKSEIIKNELQQCANEETDHLYWCQQRLYELDSHVSYLNPFWFTGSFVLGVAAGLAGDKWNLGFLAETEYQVEAHLESHLEQLPSSDLQSQKIVQQMRSDEIQHAKTAEAHGAAPLPKPIKFLMKSISKIMTSTAYYI